MDLFEISEIEVNLEATSDDNYLKLMTLSVIV